MKHTKGPWQVADYNHSLAVECTVNGIGHTVVTDQFCYPNFAQHGSEEKRANIMLIAAAPELLEALQDTLEQLTVFSDMSVTNKGAMRNAIDQATAAIKKATTQFPNA